MRGRDLLVPALAAAEGTDQRREEAGAWFTWDGGRGGGAGGGGRGHQRGNHDVVFLDRLELGLRIVWFERNGGSKF